MIRPLSGDVVQLKGPNAGCFMDSRGAGLRGVGGAQRLTPAPQTHHDRQTTSCHDALSPLRMESGSSSLPLLTSDNAMTPLIAPVASGDSGSLVGGAGQDQNTVGRE